MLPSLPLAPCPSPRRASITRSVQYTDGFILLKGDISLMGLPGDRGLPGGGLGANGYVLVCLSLVGPHGQPSRAPLAGRFRCWVDPSTGYVHGAGGRRQVGGPPPMPAVRA